MKKVFIVEDDENIVYMLKDSLETEGFSVVTTYNSKGVIEIFLKENPDIVLLDIALRCKMDGFEIAKKIRQRNNTPIIYITGRQDIDSVKKGYEAGNVDYLKKPFSTSELILRMNEILGRQSVADTLPEVFKLGEVYFRVAEHLILHNDESARLQKNENEVLKLLCINKNKVIAKSSIIDAVWGEKKTKTKEASLNNIISSLRSKLALDPNISIITIPKEGYKLTLKE